MQQALSLPIPNPSRLQNLPFCYLPYSCPQGLKTLSYDGPNTTFALKEDYTERRALTPQVLSMT
jgi:hypothetical protein